MGVEKKIILLPAILWSTIAFAQNMSRIDRLFEKNEFEKAKEGIVKSMEKDSLNIASRYYYARLFILDSAIYTTDSARIFINEALSIYDAANEDQLKELEKASLNGDSLRAQKKLVTQLAFEESLEKMTVKGFESFLTYYPDASQATQVIHFRDSLAFQEASQRATWNAYKEYMDAYPGSAYYEDALARYQVLIYEDQTKDDQLRSYIQFLEANPDTPFRKEAEEVIFRRSTIAHTWESYLSFLERYPETHLRKQIGDILYYLDKEDSFQNYNQVLKFHPLRDSLMSIQGLEVDPLYPLFINEKFGFANFDGEVLLSPRFDSIPAGYLCGNIRSEWLAVTTNDLSMVVNRKGAPVLKGIHSEIKPLGTGIQLLGNETEGYQLYHSSGYPIGNDLVMEAEVMDHRWIKFMIDGQYGLMSLTGQEILQPVFQSIEKVGAFIIVSRENRYAFTTPARLIRDSDLAMAFTAFEFDDFDLANDSLLIGFKGKEECLFDNDLDVVIPPGEYEIVVSGTAWYLKSTQGYQIYNRDRREMVPQVFPNIQVNDGWIAIRRKEDWLLISQGYHLLPMKGLDSTRLINEEAAYSSNRDSSFVIFQNGKSRNVLKNDQLVVIKSTYQDQSAQYIKITSKGKVEILDMTGTIRIEGVFEDVAFLNDTLFKVQTRGKSGIMTLNGQFLLKPEYEVVDEKNGLVFLLKNGKIGCLDLFTGTLLPAIYQSRIDKSGNYYLVSDGNKRGLVDATNQTILPAAYKEIEAWNDTSFWVLGELYWQLVSVSGSILIDNVESFIPMCAYENEKNYRIFSHQRYGIVSSRRGVLLPVIFNDIVNVGSYHHPAYFAEQFLAFSSLYVVTYVNKAGQVTFTEAYKPDHYFQIYCE